MTIAPRPGLGRDAVLELGRKLDMETLALDEAGSCGLLIDRQFLVELAEEDEAGVLWLSSPLGNPPEASASEVYLGLLRHNAMAAGQPAAELRLAIERGTGVPVLQTRLRTTALDAARLEEALFAHADAVRLWADRVALGMLGPAALPTVEPAFRPPPSVIWG